MEWVKKGHLFNVGGEFGWMNTHAQVPTALVKKDRLRVYFSTRAVPNESRTTFVDFSLEKPGEVLFLNESPILENGGPGEFDEHGVMPSSVLEHDGRVYLYYSGWSRRTTVPYSNLTGLAVSSDGGKTFKKAGRGPIISTNQDEPFSATSPHVLKIENHWHMFYCSGVDWLKIGEKYEHTYDIKRAVSRDGINWCQDGKAVIPQKNKMEAITRPVVIQLEGSYRMYFCYRGSNDFRDGENSYRIGTATSDDLVKWVRSDSDDGLAPSTEGWDSKMIAYPYPYVAHGEQYMLYNGNGFGQAGFGLAQLNKGNI